SLWLALVLLVPKRSWRTVPARLRATAAGKRRHPFGPPFPLSASVRSRLLRLLLAEAPRCLELGIPRWLAPLRAEHIGAQHRRLAEARWVASPSGWMWARLTGRITEEELLSRMKAASSPLPAPKAELRFHVHRAVPPSSWLRELA